MFGRRADGRRVKKLDPIVQMTPYLMPMRCDAQVFLEHKADYEKLSRYIEMYEGTIAPAVRLYEEDTPNDGLSSAVRAAIMEAQAEKEEEMQEIPDVQTADTAAPSESAAETPTPSVPKTEKKRAKDPAEVDALFDKVLRQYGKNKR